MGMTTTLNQRLYDLREVMQREHLVAFIFPSTDPHQKDRFTILRLRHNFFVAFHRDARGIVPRFRKVFCNSLPRRIDALSVNR